MLTITVSIVSCGDAIFSFFPASYQPFKTPFEILAILFLVVINLRGIKESVTMLAPIFILFVLTHVLMIGYGILKHLPEIGAVAGEVRSGFQGGLATLGLGGMALLFLRAFSMGGGTYTGIEAVSNGLQIMREPRVHNGKRTMVYLSTSLALTAGGILVCYLLLGVAPGGRQDPQRRPGRRRSSAAGRFGGAPGRSSPSSPKAPCCSSPPRPASSTDRGSWPTWPSTTGSPTASPPSRTA